MQTHSSINAAHSQEHVHAPADFGFAFALGTAVPLLFFALAGQRVAERVSAFRRHQRQIRVTAGIVTLLLAVALVFNLPAVLQRAIPDYTSSLQNKLGEHFTVHGKAGLPCPACREDLKRVSYESHEVVYCPNCQTGGKVLADRRLSRLVK